VSDEHAPASNVRAHLEWAFGSDAFGRPGRAHRAPLRDPQHIGAQTLSVIVWRSARYAISDKVAS
jgi:hypothetical protein